MRLTDGEVTAFNVQDGSFLSLADVLVFSVDAVIDVSLAFADSSMSGYIRGSQDGYQVVVHTADSVAVVTYQDAATTRVYEDGAVTLELSGAGPLAADTIPIPAIPVNVLLTDYNGNGTVDLQDFFLFADAFGKPANEDNKRFDLNGNDAVDLADFFLFADSFGANAG